jgi:hypothetical protein
MKAYVCMLIVEIALASEFTLLLLGNILLNFTDQGNHGYKELRHTTIFLD